MNRLDAFIVGLLLVVIACYAEGLFQGVMP